MVCSKTQKNAHLLALLGLHILYPSCVKVTVTFVALLGHFFLIASIFGLLCKSDLDHKW